uniref:(California timema) hypothetical protein n=1 Tax=Timema californicum TaxID=61474 RepID=A0A7R9P946_TIMCA|nr:unnamed protein product [Timema californicum]
MQYPEVPLNKEVPCVTFLKTGMITASNFSLAASKPTVSSSGWTGRKNNTFGAGRWVVLGGDRISTRVRVNRAGLLYVRGYSARPECRPSGRVALLCGCAKNKRGKYCEPDNDYCYIPSDHLASNALTPRLKRKFPEGVAFLPNVPSDLEESVRGTYRELHDFTNNNHQDAIYVNNQQWTPESIVEQAFSFIDEEEVDENICSASDLKSRYSENTLNNEPRSNKCPYYYSDCLRENPDLALNNSDKQKLNLDSNGFCDSLETRGNCSNNFRYKTDLHPHQWDTWSISSQELDDLLTEGIHYDQDYDESSQLFDHYDTGEFPDWNVDGNFKNNRFSGCEKFVTPPCVCSWENIDDALITTDKDVEIIQDKICCIFDKLSCNLDVESTDRKEKVMKEFKETLLNMINSENPVVFNELKQSTSWDEYENLPIIEEPPETEEERDEEGDSNIGSSEHDGSCETSRTHMTLEEIETEQSTPLLEKQCISTQRNIIGTHHPIPRIVIEHPKERQNSTEEDEWLCEEPTYSLLTNRKDVVTEEVEYGELASEDEAQGRSLRDTERFLLVPGGDSSSEEIDSPNSKRRDLDKAAHRKVLKKRVDFDENVSVLESSSGSDIEDEEYSGDNGEEEGVRVSSSGLDSEELEEEEAAIEMRDSNETMIHDEQLLNKTMELGRSTVHPTEIRTSISPSSEVELNTTSALANYATEAGRTEQLARHRYVHIFRTSWPAVRPRAKHDRNETCVSAPGEAGEIRWDAKNYDFRGSVRVLMFSKHRVAGGSTYLSFTKACAVFKIKRRRMVGCQKAQGNSLENSGKQATPEASPWHIITSLTPSFRSRSNRDSSPDPPVISRLDQHECEALNHSAAEVAMGNLQITQLNVNGIPSRLSQLAVCNGTHDANTRAPVDLAQNSNVQDAFVIAVEQQARERLEQLSALKRIKPVDMTKLSQQGGIPSKCHLNSCPGADPDNFHRGQSPPQFHRSCTYSIFGIRGGAALWRLLVFFDVW